MVTIAVDFKSASTNAFPSLAIKPSFPALFSLVLIALMPDNYFAE